MGFNNYQINIILRAVVLVASTFLLAHLIYNDGYILFWLIVLGLVIFQVFNLVVYLDATNKAIARFFKRLSEETLPDNFQVKETDDYYEVLKSEFNKVLDSFRKHREEVEQQYQYIKTIVQHASIGIFTFNREGNIQIINRAARELLEVKQLNNINELKVVNPKLVDHLKSLKTGGRALVKLESEEGPIQLSIYAIELTLKDESFKLISLQNIQSELEEKEMEAWQNLVRVLTHEIMNSVTPISSLAALVEKELEYQLHNDMEVNAISNDEVKDLYKSVETIHKRSEGLIRFVSDFRNLTIIPKPKLQTVSVAELFHHVLTLMQFEINEYKIALTQSIEPETAEIAVDQELISQVLINLMKNAVEALRENQDRRIHLSYSMEHQQPTIKIADNGSGIDEEALQKIFIPFFTTKRTGSGIGLSLSRQIMRQHGGNITVKTHMGQGTEFTLKFNKEMSQLPVIEEVDVDLS